MRFLRRREEASASESGREKAERSASSDQGRSSERKRRRYSERWERKKGLEIVAASASPAIGLEMGRIGGAGVEDSIGERDG